MKIKKLVIKDSSSGEVLFSVSSPLESIESWAKIYAFIPTIYVLSCVDIEEFIV